MLKFLLIVLSIFFLIRILGRMFVVSTFNNLNKKVQDEMQRRQNYNAPPRQEGQVTIDPQVGKRKGNDDGEYVDYEEIK
jgi:hypothetical protein